MWDLELSQLSPVHAAIRTKPWSPLKTLAVCGEAVRTQALSIVSREEAKLLARTKQLRVPPKPKSVEGPVETLPHTPGPTAAVCYGWDHPHSPTKIEFKNSHEEWLDMFAN